MLTYMTLYYLQMEADADEDEVCNEPVGRPDSMLMHLIKGFADVRDVTVLPPSLLSPLLTQL